MLRRSGKNVVFVKVWNLIFGGFRVFCFAKVVSK